MAIQPIKLAPEDQRALEALGPDIAALESEIARAKRAGIDVTQLEADLKSTKSLREGILREYGGR
jgi:hypothetical protein